MNPRVLVCAQRGRGQVLQQNRAGLVCGHFNRGQVPMSRPASFFSCGCSDHLEIPFICGCSNRPGLSPSFGLNTTKPVDPNVQNDSTHRSDLDQLTPVRESRVLTRYHSKLRCRSHTDMFQNAGLARPTPTRHRDISRTRKTAADFDLRSCLTTYSPVNCCRNVCNSELRVFSVLQPLRLCNFAGRLLVENLHESYSAITPGNRLTALTFMPSQSAPLFLTAVQRIFGLVFSGGRSSATCTSEICVSRERFAKSRPWGACIRSTRRSLEQATSGRESRVVTTYPSKLRCTTNMTCFNVQTVPG